MTSGNHYDPAAPGLLSFAAAREAFLADDDSASDHLERCLETISGREATVRAFTEIDADAARAAADAADRRYHAGNPLSVLDGMPVAIKDIFDTQGLPTEHGSLAYAGRWPKWDGAIAFALRRGGAVILGKTVTTELAFATPRPCARRRIAGPGRSSPAAGRSTNIKLIKWHDCRFPYRQSVCLRPK